MLAHVAQQFDGGKAAVGHRNQPPSGQPARGLQQRLPGPVGQLLVPLAALRGVAFGGRQHGQERQGPNAVGPGNGSQQHHAQPAQATGFDEVAVAGPNGIPIDPARLDLGPPAPLDGVVKADHDRSPRHEGRDKQQQQPMRDGAGGPAPEAEHAVVDGEARALVEAHDAQRRRDGAPTRGKQDTRHQHQDVAPDCGGEVGRKGRIQAASTAGTLVGMAQASAWAVTRETQPLRAEVVTMAGADTMRERIAAHPWPRGGVEVVRANRGYTLYSRRTGGPVARLRPTGKVDNVQVLWWRRETWATPGDFGPLTLTLDEALDFVATEGFFWINA